MIHETAPVHLHPHAIERAGERGATEIEIVEAVRTGESFPAKRGRTVFRRNFSTETVWRGRRYANKQIEAIAAAPGSSSPFSSDFSEAVACS